MPLRPLPKLTFETLPLSADNGSVSKVNFGNGLSGINERCQQLNGVVNVTHEHGMSIKITLPENSHD